MKTGIIVLFSNNEEEIKKKHFNKLLGDNLIKLCFVNNASKDKTLEILKDIMNTTINNISIVDVKKNKGIRAAVKAGLRYLANNEDLSSIIYFEFYKYKEFLILENKFNVTNNNFLSSFQNTHQRSIFKNVFSLEQLTKKK